MRAQVYQKLRRQLLVGLAHRLPSCKEATQLVSTTLEQRLPLQQRIALKLHLWTCSLCRRYAQQLHLIKHAAQNYAVHEPMNHTPFSSSLSAEARERMKRSLRASS